MGDTTKMNDECLWCSDKFKNKDTYYHLDGFCSEDCCNAFKELHVEMPLKVHNYKTKICVICGSAFVGNEEFCSAECSIPYCEERGIWYQRVKLKLPPKYCKKFNDNLRERVRTFFDKKCVLCSKTELENGQALSVHHVNYDKKAGCNGNKVLLVSLCKVCHRKVHKDKEYWETYFENRINTEYNSKCYYTKEEYNILKYEECSS